MCTDGSPHSGVSGRFRVGVSGVYACSAGCHPGGSVIGAAGYNAANAILEDGA